MEQENQILKSTLQDRDHEIIGLKFDKEQLLRQVEGLKGDVIELRHNKGKFKDECLKKLSEFSNVINGNYKVSE